jgi:KDO2-lipid IV(A) lauroyltransferase
MPAASAPFSREGGLVRRGSLWDYTVYVVVRLLICLVQAVDIEAGRRMLRGLAWIMADVLRVRGRVVEDNLRHAFPQQTASQRRALVRRMWEHLLLMVLEVAHAGRKIHETNWRDYIELDHPNVAPMVALLLSDRPKLMVSGHFGNFEVAGYMFGVLGFPTYAVARNLDNPYLHDFVTRFRGMTGQHIIPKKDYQKILAVLAGGGVLTILGDQYAGDKGCWVNFFGRPASTHKAIAVLSLEHGAPLTVAYARRLGRPLHFQMKVHAMADPRLPGQPAGSVFELTQWYANRLEEIVRLAPEQYWWVHRRWKQYGFRPRKHKSKAA